MNAPKQQRSGAFVSIAAGVGSGLGAAVGVITGDWSWMPVILSVCITLGSIWCLVDRLVTERRAR